MTSEDNTVVGLAGDWHGSFQWTRAALKTLGDTGVKQIFHAGDFSLGWPGKWPDLINICEKICKQYDMLLYVTPGNHENWDWINSHASQDGDGLYWMTDHTAFMHRNTVLNLPHNRKLLSLGGAVSVDRSFRTRGVDYFPEEEITYGDMIRLEDVMKDAGDIDIMICHDAPDGGTDAVQRIIDIPPHLSIFPEEGIIGSHQHRQTVNTAFKMVQPKVFAHGHFHAADMKQTDDTLFVSLGCNQQYHNLALLDLKILDAEFIRLDERYLL